VTKIRGDKSIGFIHMEIPQGNSLYCKQTKMSFFSFLFFLLQSWRTGRQNNSCPIGKVAHWEAGGGKERGWEGENGVKNVYACI
jgi:hypothetical protein